MKYKTTRSILFIFKPSTLVEGFVFISDVIATKKICLRKFMVFRQRMIRKFSRSYFRLRFLRWSFKETTGSDAVKNDKVAFSSSRWSFFGSLILIWSENSWGLGSKWGKFRDSFTRFAFGQDASCQTWADMLRSHNEGWEYISDSNSRSPIARVGFPLKKFLSQIKFHR